MLLLPEPLGPTITLTPGENSRLTRSGNDLNPFIEIDFRYTRRPFPCSESRPRRTFREVPAQAPNWARACSAATCSAAFLLRPRPDPTRSESTIAATSKVLRWGGPVAAITS